MTLKIRVIQIKTELIYHYFYPQNGQKLKRLEIHSFGKAMWKQAFLYFANEHLNWYNFMDLEISIKITNTHILYSATSLRRIYPIETHTCKMASVQGHTVQCYLY